MMGQLSNGQERLFYSFNIEDHIPANHLLRNIDRCLDLSDLRHYLAVAVKHGSFDQRRTFCFMIESIGFAVA